MHPPRTPRAARTAYSGRRSGERRPPCAAPNQSHRLQSRKQSGFSAASEADSEPRAKRAAGPRERAVSSRINTPRERAVSHRDLPSRSRVGSPCSRSSAELPPAATRARAAIAHSGRNSAEFRRPVRAAPNPLPPLVPMRLQSRERIGFRAASEAGRRPARASGFIADQNTAGARGPSVLASGRCAKHFPGGAETLVPHPPSVNGSADPCPARVGRHAPRDSPGKAGWWRIRKTNGHSRCLRASRRIRLRLAMPRSSGGKGKNSGHTQKGREPWLAPLWKEDREQGETTRPRALRWIRLLQPAVCPYTPGR
jgi:hypothetical protein